MALDPRRIEISVARRDLAMKALGLDSVQRDIAYITMTATEVTVFTVIRDAKGRVKLSGSEPVLEQTTYPFYTP